MRNDILATAFVTGALSLLINTEAQAQPTDQLAFSASACTPASAGGFEGSGASGFVWQDDGSWRNNENDDDEILICPIAYQYGFEPIGNIDVIVNVIDFHPSKSVWFRVYGQSADGNADQLGEASSGQNFIGRRQLTIRFLPGPSVRYLWLRISVPHKHADLKSGVAGYRINRVGV